MKDRHIAGDGAGSGARADLEGSVLNRSASGVGKGVADHGSAIACFQERSRASNWSGDRAAGNNGGVCEIYRAGTGLDLPAVGNRNVGEGHAGICIIQREDGSATGYREVARGQGTTVPKTETAASDSRVACVGVRCIQGQHAIADFRHSQSATRAVSNTELKHSITRSERGPVGVLRVKAKKGADLESAG